MRTLYFPHFPYSLQIPQGAREEVVAVNGIVALTLGSAFGNGIRPQMVPFECVRLAHFRVECLDV